MLRAEDVAPPDLLLQLSLSKEEIVQCEPVVIKAWVRNISDKPQKIFRAFDTSSDQLKVFLVDAEEKTHEYKWNIIDCGPLGEMELANRLESVQGSVHTRLILAAAPDTLLDTPGKYQVYVTYSYAKEKKLWSTPVTLTVKPAEGVDKQALERFRGWPQAKLLSKATTCQDIADEFEAVIQLYPESVYVPWCYYFVGWADQHRKEYDEKTRAIKSTDRYETLLEKFPDFPMKAEVKYEIARELFRLGKADEALLDLKRMSELSRRNREVNLFLFYNTRAVLGTLGDGNTKVGYDDFPAH
jgi:hypothetical protein